MYVMTEIMCRMTEIMYIMTEIMCRMTEITRSYNGLLVQNTFLQVSLLPELCRHHQCNLGPERSNRPVRTMCDAMFGPRKGEFCKLPFSSVGQDLKPWGKEVNSPCFGSPTALQWLTGHKLSSSLPCVRDNWFRQCGENYACNIGCQ